MEQSSDRMEAGKVSRTGNQSVVELFPGHWQGLASVLQKVGHLSEFIHMPQNTWVCLFVCFD